MYWRTAASLSGGWKKLLDSGNTYAANSNGTAVSVARNTDTTIATINGVAVKIKIPASDNTWRPIGTGATDAAAGNHNHDSTYLKLVGGTLTGGLEIKGHIAGDSGTTGHGLYSGGAYHNAYNNIILHGDASTGTSGIAFVSDKAAVDGTITNINAPSDRAFIQYHAYGVTTATAEGTAPTLATSGEAGRLVIGIGNDSGDKIVLQAPGTADIVHQMGTTSYPIPHTTNTNGTVGGTTTPVYVEAGVIKAGTALGASAYHADSYFALSGHTHTTTLASGGTATVTLSANTSYTLTAGGTSVIFKTPADSDTKNTAGSTNSTSKLFLIGATSQAANPTTNSYQYTYTNNGLLSALKLGLNLNGTEKAYLEWNNTDQSIDFIFN